MARTYNDAITALNTLQSNHMVVEAIRKNVKESNKKAIPETIDWFRRVGYEPSDFDRLKPIHIAGTKGKGSTSAFISSILSQYLPSLTQPNPLFQKIGLYTSPHLRFVRERIQINNEPLSPDAFAKYFFEVWDRLEAAARQRNEPTDVRAKPAYFRFLTLMALHTYMREGVDTAVIEVGIGGEYDSTNILVSPIVTGITSLGIDHTATLGNTIEEIAWHKGGIMKRNAPCFTAPQPPTALDVLRKRADEIPTSLTIIDQNPSIAHLRLGLSAPFQHTNASLALAIVSSHLSTLGHPFPPVGGLPEETIRGLQSVRLQGRCETRRDDKVDMTWYIDVAHTLESIRLAGEWFASQCPLLLSSPLRTPSNPPRILLFNQQTRDPSPLLRAVHSTVSTALDTTEPFTHAVFCANMTFKTGFKEDLVGVNVDRSLVEMLEVQRGMVGMWQDLNGGSSKEEGEGGFEDTKEEGIEEDDGERKGEEGLDTVAVKASIEEAVLWCRGVVKEWEKTQRSHEQKEAAKVLVTGSVHLVGGFLEVLDGSAEN